MCDSRRSYEKDIQDVNFSFVAQRSKGLDVVKIYCIFARPTGKNFNPYRNNPNLLLQYSIVSLPQVERCPGERLRGGRGEQDHHEVLLPGVGLLQPCTAQRAGHAHGPGAFQAARSTVAQRDPI